MNPYETLGLDKSATKAQIRAAAKRKMHKHHPDKGGDEAEFKRINAAQKLLCDDSARKRYDETGSTDERPQAMTDEMRAIATLGKMFIAILERDSERGGDPIYACSVEIAKGLREGPAAIERQRKKIARTEKVLAKQLKQTGGKPGYLQNALTTHIAGLRTQLDQMELCYRIGPLMQEILKDYKWERDTVQFYTQYPSSFSILTDNYGG